jgi:DNA-binding HxlR family transcriptional regulator
MQGVVERRARGAALASTLRHEAHPRLTDDGTIPAQVCALIRASIHSLEELEVLLILYNERTRSWSAEQLSNELRISETLVVAALQALIVNKLAARVGDGTPPQYRYLVQDPDAEPIVDELARTYAHNRVPVLMQISSHAIERVRKGALKTFSEAFRWPGGKRDD